MTLGGIAACIGVVIDDAIAMVENIAITPVVFSLVRRNPLAS